MKRCYAVSYQPDLAVVLHGARATPSQQKLYLEYLYLARLDIMLSFLPTPWAASGASGEKPLHLHHPPGFQCMIQHHNEECAVVDRLLF